jgi:glycosyltransferase involved in cell wall biosynthesis
MAELFSGRGIPRELIRVIPYGFDVTPAETTEKAKLLSFGYVGSINEHKGAHVLITAFKKANVQDKATLSLYGDLDIAKPSYAEQLRQSVAENPAIRLLGSFPSEQASKIISSFDVLVIPSIWYENTPTVIHIAFACKIPIIGSNVPGITELVKNEINGLIFERGDTDQLSSQIRRVVETPELLRKMSLSMPKIKPIHDYVDQLEKCF